MGPMLRGAAGTGELRVPRPVDRGDGNGGDCAGLPPWLCVSACVCVCAGIEGSPSTVT